MTLAARFYYLEAGFEAKQTPCDDDFEIATAYKTGLAMTFWVPDNDIPGYSLCYEKFRQANSL